MNSIKGVQYVIHRQIMERLDLLLKITIIKNPTLKRHISSCWIQKLKTLWRHKLRHFTTKLFIVFEQQTRFPVNHV